MYISSSPVHTAILKAKDPDIQGLNYIQGVSCATDVQQILKLIYLKIKTPAF
jgi:hypothetical protein